MTLTLKKCIFCKGYSGELTDLGPNRGYTVICLNCEARGPETGTSTSAVIEWNAVHASRQSQAAPSENSKSDK